MMQIEEYIGYLRYQERSQSTINKYRHDIGYFMKYIDGKTLDKEIVITYKKHLMQMYKPSSANSMLTALNGYLSYIGRDDLKVKLIRYQRPRYEDTDRSITRGDYLKLLDHCDNKRDRLIIETICSTGIRVSELQYFKVENYKDRKILITNKGKQRIVFLTKKLVHKIEAYIKSVGIEKGSIFITKNNKPIDRIYIWRMMKRLAIKAKVNVKKVFPHNFRHLFAKCYYKIKKDIVKLSDILGHSSIDTTKIYIKDTSEKYFKDLELTGLLLCHILDRNNMTKSASII